MSKTQISKNRKSTSKFTKKKFLYHYFMLSKTNTTNRFLPPLMVHIHGTMHVDRVVVCTGRRFGSRSPPIIVIDGGAHIVRLVTAYEYTVAYVRN